MERRRKPSCRSSRSSASTPCATSDSRMVSAMLSPIQSKLAEFDTLKKGSTKTVSARAKFGARQAETKMVRSRRDIRI